MGNYSEWIVELDGQRIGRLLNPSFAEMFWERYDVVPDSGFEEILLNVENWRADRFKFRDMRNGSPCKLAWASSDVEETLREGEVRMYGLYSEGDHLRARFRVNVGRVAAVALVAMFGTVILAWLFEEMWQ